MILTSLARAYDRLPGVAPFGYSPEKIGAVISLHPDGRVARVIDLRASDKKRTPPVLPVPQAVKRTVAIAPNFLWDKTAYALGLTAGEGKRTAQEHQAFRDRHAEWLAGSHDEGLQAFLAFLSAWEPGQGLPGWSDDLLDRNVIFALESERLDNVFLHDRKAARDLWLRVLGEREQGSQLCLVNGQYGPVTRLHPEIKGVWIPKDSARVRLSLISFNLDAFESYGHAQGDNAPVSEAAAFAYGTALNHFLRPGSVNRVQIGDASTVFWADASDMSQAALAERLALAMFTGKGAEPTAEDDAKAARQVAPWLDRIRKGQPLPPAELRLVEGVTFTILGLAPNAARLSVRFFWQGTFGQLLENYRRFLADVAIEPGPREPDTSLWRRLIEIAVQGKRENVPKGLAGDWMRAVITGARYPESLLATALLRIRADQSVNALRAGIVKAMLVRNHNERRDLVALDEESDSTAYQLGRLFAVMEGAQYAALGRVNASIADRYYAAASSTPARVFPPLLRGLRVHVSDARKRGQGGWIEPRVGQIMGRLPPEFPRTLTLTDQGRFAVGYYHEKSRRAAKADAPADIAPDTPFEDGDE